MGVFEQFPYANFHELNADWLMNELLALKTSVEQFVAINALKYADPIQWNITKQYEKNTIVIDPLTGTAYISVQPVPSGVALTRTEYWTVVFDLGSFVARAARNFTDKFEEDTTLTATFPSAVNDWLIWGDTLYRVISNIVAGDQYVIGSNIQHFTIENIIGHPEDLTTESNNIVAAINEVMAIIGSLTDLTTEDKSNIVAAINEQVTKISGIQNFIGDETLTTEAQILSGAINELNADVSELNGDVDELNGDVDELNGDVNELNDAVNGAIALAKTGKDIASLIFNDIYDTSEFPYYPQGGCYVKDNLYVQYFTDNTAAETGKLNCYDIINGTLEWSYSLQCYHGNSITYNPDDDKLYICGCNTYDGQVINMIFVVDFTSPSVIERTIILPDTNKCYTLAYDRDSEHFFGWLGGSNITEFSNDLTETIATIHIDKNGLNVHFQGITAIVDGVAYDCSYDSMSLVVGWDIKTGARVSVFNFPDYASEVRRIEELESVTFDYINKRMLISCVTQTTGETCFKGTHRVFNIVEINALKDIIYYRPLPSRQSTNTRNLQRIICRLSKSYLPPFLTYSTRNRVQTFGDLLNYVKHNGFCEVTLSHDDGIDTVYKPDFSYTNMAIFAGTSGSAPKFELAEGRNCTLLFNGVHFTGGYVYETGNPDYYASLEFQLAHITFRSCVFEDYDTESTRKYHARFIRNCIILADSNNTYQGTVTDNFGAVASFINGVYT